MKRNYALSIGTVLFCISIFGLEDTKWNNHAGKSDVRWGKVVEALLIWGQEGVYIPGPQRFYEVALANDNGLIGIISGTDVKSVQVVAEYFRTLGSFSVAKRRAVAIDNISIDQLNDIACTSKNVARLCDVVLPVEVQQHATIKPCTHEGFACERYWPCIKQELVGRVAFSCECHEALVVVPHLVPMQ